MYSKIENLFGVVDRTVAEIYDQYPAEVKCGPGCSDCCHAAFDVSFLEASYLAAALVAAPELLARIAEQAGEAAAAYDQLIRQGGDISRTRIRCPLLDDKGLCCLHQRRPINCRTYGTPTLIAGRAHVCGLSAFDPKGKYPTIDLAPLQRSLRDYSVELVGEDFGTRRFPIAYPVLRPRLFLPRE